MVSISLRAEPSDNEVNLGLARISKPSPVVSPVVFVERRIQTAQTARRVRHIGHERDEIDVVRDQPLD